MITWSMKLLDFSIQYKLTGPIKVQVLADFIVELSLIMTNHEQENTQTLYVDGDPIAKEAKQALFQKEQMVLPLSNH